MKSAKSNKTPPRPATSSAAERDQLNAVPQELVAERARTLWEQRGRPSDQDLQIWLEAERQLNAQSGRKQTADPIKPRIDQTEPEESLSSEVEQEMDEETPGGSRRSATSL
ncbi:MAG TPA: DUF2934 domain-containing protein [Opitutaceae bacterium]|jgi:hypothetical protein|nr:DUF2934 domain-containing protein [Opitutaceae bacterium]